MLKQSSENEYCTKIFAWNRKCILLEEKQQGYCGFSTWGFLKARVGL